MRAQAAFLVLLLLPLAGCLQKTETAAPVATGVQTQAASAAAQAAANATAAPAWSVGQSWTHKWTLVSQGGNLTFLIRTVVAEQAGDGWTLATDNETMAAFHGAFIIPTLGHFSRGLLQTVGETRFPWYHFPLTANATWSDSVVSWDGAKAATTAVQGRVTSVSTNGAGTVYHIALATKDHLVAAYDYDSATQWFDAARFYDDKGNLAFLSEMQETGRGFKGRLYDDTGALLLDHQDLLVPAAALAQPNPEQDFAMTADQNRLLVFLISFAGGGAHDSELVAPDGTRHGAQAIDVMAPIQYNDSTVFLLPGQAGTWHVATYGAGAFVSGGVVQSYGLHERVIDL